MSSLRSRVRSLSATLRRTVLAAAMIVLCTLAVANPPCPSDLDGDGAVGGGDISLILLDFGPCPGCGADLDQDGEVSGSDLSLLLLSFGPCVGPSWATVLEWSPDPVVIYDANLRADITATHWPWRVRDNGTGIEMVLMPPGSYQRGCSPSQQYGCSSIESPVHQVTLTQAFYLGRTEVTQAQWVAKMGSNPSYFTGDTSRPVELVTWNDIQPFCSNNGLRLPTEAEWEYAYRAGTTTAFHGWAANPSGTNDDGQLGAIAWFSGNSGSQTRPLGGKAPNGFGLFDMAGNVYEWVNDRYGDYGSSAQTNPTGPGSGSDRVLRGGGWVLNADDCRASGRSDGHAPDFRSYAFGFRVARTP